MHNKPRMRRLRRAMGTTPIGLYASSSCDAAAAPSLPWQVLGYHGPIYMTYPTLAIAPVVLGDYIRVRSRASTPQPQHTRQCRSLHRQNSTREKDEARIAEIGCGGCGRSPHPLRCFARASHAQRYVSCTALLL
jgi:hypothetical protein